MGTWSKLPYGTWARKLRPQGLWDPYQPWDEGSSPVTWEATGQKILPGFCVFLLWIAVGLERQSLSSVPPHSLRTPLGGPWMAEYGVELLPLVRTVIS